LDNLKKIGGSIYGQIFSVGTGIISGRGLSFLNTLLAVAIFGQEVFGYLAVFIAITSIVSSVNLLTLDKILPNFEDNTVRIIVLALCIQLIISASLPILLAPSLGWEYSEYMAIQIIATGLTSIGLALNVREKKFGWLSIIEVLPVFVFFGFLGTCWYFDIKDPEWLLAGRSISFLLAALFYAFFVILPYIKKVRFRLLPLVALYQSEKLFIFQVTLGNFCNRGAYYFPTILIADYFGLEAAAQYGLMLQLCMVPMGMAESAVGKVYQGHLATMVRSGISGNFDRNKIKFALLGLAVLFLITMYYIVPFVIQKGLDGNWELAIDLIYIMSPAFAVMIFVSPLTVAFFVFKMGKIEMFGQAIWLMLILFSMGVGIYLNNIIVGISGFSLITIVRLLILYFYAENSVSVWEKQNDNKIL
jgi:O-antigen/teichoic acid export membrane protein